MGSVPPQAFAHRVAFVGLLALGFACDRAESPSEGGPEDDATGDAKENGRDTNGAGDGKGERKALNKKANKKKKKNKKKNAADGPQHVCSVCGSTAVFKEVKGRKSAQCPVCKCKERHRLFLHYLEHGTELLHQKLDVLHFSPQQCEETVLRHQPNWNYVTTDYVGNEDVRIDLTKADQPDASWDLVILYHIFEHIPDDKAAIAETFRILRPGGRAIVQVPIEEGVTTTLEDPTITSRAERLKHFGQWDHVRKYAPQDLRERLEAAGFEVEIVDYLGKLDAELISKHRMSGVFDPPLDESIWIATKPK